MTNSKSHKIYHNSSDNIDLVLGYMFCGYFESQSVRENGEICFLKTLSRISTKKIGVRMISRGINDNSNVSFFVETKFSIKSSKEMDTFVILSGSVPVYWLQDDPHKPQKIIFTKNQAENVDPFLKHFEKLEKNYGQIVVLDLLGSRKYERILSKMYRDLCHKYVKNYIHFYLNYYSSDYELMKKELHRVIDSFLKMKEDSAEKVKDDTTIEENSRDSDCSSDSQTSNKSLSKDFLDTSDISLKNEVFSTIDKNEVLKDIDGNTESDYKRAENS